MRAGGCEAFWLPRHPSQGCIHCVYGGGLNAAQQLMGHARATTTDIYVRSAGLYADKQILVDALGDSGIGVAANALFTKMPHEREAHEAFCKQENVNNILQ